MSPDMRSRACGKLVAGGSGASALPCRFPRHAAGAPCLACLRDDRANADRQSGYDGPPFRVWNWTLLQPIFLAHGRVM